METVEVVIKIPKRTYDGVSKNGCIVYGDDAYFIGQAIKNGTVLPKNHGRLIDGDAIITEAKEKMKYPLNYKYMECVIAHMNLAPTIIEADKEVEIENR